MNQLPLAGDNRIGNRDALDALVPGAGIAAEDRNDVEDGLPASTY
jgi:hypothetical protein